MLLLPACCDCVFAHFYSVYSILSPCGHPAITDIRYSDSGRKVRFKMTRYYGCPLQRELTVMRTNGLYWKLGARKGSIQHY